MLTPVKFHHRNNHYDYFWTYQCECGEFKIIRKSSVDSGHTKSCGCLQRKQRIFNGNNYGNKTHGESDPPTKEYRCWEAMKRRCLNPNTEKFKDYGGRGIKVCNRWINSYENFLEDIGRAPGPEYSIDRINNNGNYEPGNCRWATIKQQNNNQRKRKAK